MLNAVYEKITERMIKLLESGIAPWSKPWKPGDVPRNAISGRPYTGLNVFILQMAREERGYKSNAWMTFNQAMKIKGDLKGEHGTAVIFWKLMHHEDEESGKTNNFAMLRYYTVFNADQVKGYVPPAAAEPEPFDPLEAAESILEKMPQKPEIKYGGNQAFYSSQSDYVQLPPREQFKAVPAFYSCAFHELAHSTGHASRLERFVAGYDHHFASNDYSKEELIAEMTATFLCAESGIENFTIDNSAAYIKSWIEALQNDPKMVIQAASAAQKAANFILGKQPAEAEAAES